MFETFVHLSVTFGATVRVNQQHKSKGGTTNSVKGQADR
jgi:hypothetical protein